MGRQVIVCFLFYDVSGLSAFLNLLKSTLTTFMHYCQLTSQSHQTCISQHPLVIDPRTTQPATTKRTPSLLLRPPLLSYHEFLALQLTMTLTNPTHLRRYLPLPLVLLTLNYSQLFLDMFILMILQVAP